ncbi:MAG: glutamine synthetase III [Chlorobium sp.]|uniref:glutamine synthetase III family protein n=1 Tax=Chlorobium sp. TaxID=1095 RepID=UPI001D28FAD5|nr:glutamine synthetase III [Chlorobium sp.]MBN1278399.1 glutamine synthetase III [Chlorobiaceae bacterium]MCF8217127.1 glutamine synthetase III [Chlorobium sp.]MCF8271980.1 glutamine synthetase III [Chlorobium sp.]MCF8288345.1 glutamine synthetase III [Chlorobium sp.]MCF8291936.1 glutamine synthetase III [Chlorobium sp.]
MDSKVPVSSYFGAMTFDQKAMRARLPKEVFQALQGTIRAGKKITEEIAGVVAHGMKEWAMEKGATHYTHWFQPMTGSTAEKHDAFLSIDRDGTPIERFSGEQLIQGEPDASSFPSGGMRTTFEARGYTAWDPSSPAFLMKGGNGLTLCIPTVFISYHGEALDAKTPLLRSMDAVSNSAMRLLDLLGVNGVSRVKTFAGCEQEYFLIDKKFYSERPDLIMCGRTLLGALPPKGQQLEDHYFGSIPDRVLEFMQDVEHELYLLGIPAKTRHNEVAPHQFEIAPIFEEANIAVDHNLLVMEVMRKVADKKGFAMLLMEKPFAGINGSGKHNNWSIGTDTGINLLDPGDTPTENINFLVFLVAVLKGVYKRSDVLRMSIASIGNDHRLGANEAPPAVVTVFLGELLETVLDAIESGKVDLKTEKQVLNLGLSQVPLLNKDYTDRNRTSPFAFTGNKFEFRAVGSSQAASVPNMVLNTLMAEALDELSDAIEAKIAGGKDRDSAILETIREGITATRAIRYPGDNYSESLQAAARERGLPNLKNTPQALRTLEKADVKAMFVKYGVLTEQEIESRLNIRLERYVKGIDIEARTLQLMLKTLVIPDVSEYQGDIGSSFNNLLAAAEAICLSDAAIASQAKHLRNLAENLSLLIDLTAELDEAVEKIETIESEFGKADFCAEELLPLMNKVRAVSDMLELMVDRSRWQLPTYSEMLFEH